MNRKNQKNPPQKSKKFQKKSKNHRKTQKLKNFRNGQKIRKSKKKHLKKIIFFFSKKKHKNNILFVSQYQDFAIQPELSSPGQILGKKIWKKIEKSQKIPFFFKQNKIKKKKKNFPKRKNAIPLVFPNYNVSLQPELSSSPCFRIQGWGGVP